jgi:integrase
MKGKSKSYQNLSKVASLNFERYCNSNGITTQKWLDDLKTKSEDDCKSTFFYQTQIWINTLKLTHKGKRNYFGIIKKLARSNGLKISKDDVQDAELDFGDKNEETKYSLSLDDIHLILKNSTWKKRGLYLFLMSTALRPKEAMSLVKSDFTLLPDGHYLINLRSGTTKKKRQREVFASKECSPYITRTLKDLSKNDLVWTTQRTPEYAVINADSVFRDLIERIGLNQKYETGRNKLNLYCFRAYFYTQASLKFGDEYAHKMLGHDVPLAVYDRKTPDEKLKMYQELEPNLTADQTEKLKIENDQLRGKDQQITELREELKNAVKMFLLYGNTKGLSLEEMIKQVKDTRLKGIDEEIDKIGQ